MVILVSSPATISMMSVTGISLISYWGATWVGSWRCRRAWERACEKGLASSMAKLWMWDRLLTLMRLDDSGVESARERSDGAGEG